jgi:hypothetical protein
LSFASYLSIHSSSNFHPLVGRGVCEFGHIFLRLVFFPRLSFFFIALYLLASRFHRLTRPGFAKCIDLVSYFGRQSYPRSCSD